MPSKIFSGHPAPESGDAAEKGLTDPGSFAIICRSYPVVTYYGLAMLFLVNMFHI